MIPVGNVQIGNIDWKQIRLETKKKDWKQQFQIGNKKRKLKTIFLDWKQKAQLGNTTVSYS